MSKTTIGVSHEPGEEGGVMICIFGEGRQEVLEIPKEIALSFLADFARAVCNAHGAPPPTFLQQIVGEGKTS